MKVYLSKNTLCLEFDYDPLIIAQIKGHLKGYRWDALYKRWEAPNIQENLKAVTNIGFDTRHIYRELEESKQATEKIFQDMKHEVKTLYPFLYGFQVDGVAKAIINNSLLVADEMGLGKTITGFAVANYRLMNRQVDHVVIVSPKSIVSQWQHEIKRFFNKDSTIITGKYEQRREIYETKPEILILNYELFVTKIITGQQKVLKDFWKLVQFINNQFFILDEMSLLKNPRALRTIYIKRYKPKYIIGLTGTPIENRLRDAYTLGNIIFPNWMQKYEFYKYCIFDKVKMGDKQFSQLHGYRDIDTFMRRLMEITIRRKRADVGIEMPKLIIETRNIPLSKEQRYFEEAIKTEIRREFDLGRVDTMLHQFVLLQMLENGIELLKQSEAKSLDVIRDEIDKSTDVSNKVKDLQLVLEELQDEKIIVFTRYRKMANLLVDKIEDPCVLATSETDTEKALKIFKETPGRTILVATDVFTYGVDIPEATVVINFDLLWNPQKMKQRIYRAYRVTSPGRVLAINMVSEGLEDYMYRVMGEKDLLSDKVLAFNLQEQLLKFIGR